VLRNYQVMAKKKSQGKHFKRSKRLGEEKRRKACVVKTNHCKSVKKEKPLPSPGARDGFPSGPWGRPKKPPGLGVPGGQEPGGKGGA